MYRLCFKVVSPRGREGVTYPLALSPVSSGVSHPTLPISLPGEAAPAGTPGCCIRSATGALWELGVPVRQEPTGHSRSKPSAAGVLEQWFSNLSEPWSPLEPPVGCGTQIADGHSYSSRCACCDVIR